ncbi:MAG: tetratricopeptide repeat protein [Nostocaceae cyanobacterium]|nr:tetratricopeptide repeat protein [Nostocaceae cyanobacterium]
MDGITVLRSLQSDFIKRLSSGCLLHCPTEGQHSELTVISGERLKQLREFCWQMAEKYKRVSPVRDVFLNFLKGKLGEEVVKERLGDLITEVDYEKRLGGDGKIDFTLTSDSAIGIEVKSRHGSIDRVRWSISSEEVEKNAVVVCIFIQEEVSEAQSEYHLFLAGFLPTQMIKLKTGRIAFGIDQLLYGGGLCSYLEQLKIHHFSNLYRKKYPSYQHISTYKLSDNYPNYTIVHEDKKASNQLDINQGDEYFDQGEYDAAIASYNMILQLKKNDIDIYYKRGLARYKLGDYQGAIVDFTQVINVNHNYVNAYNKSGLARYHLGDYEGAIADFTQAIRINPYDAILYMNRGYIRSNIGDNQGAVEDYTEAIKINPNYHNHQSSDNLVKNHFHADILIQSIEINANDAVGYKNRGNARYDLGDYQGAIVDYTQVININPDDADAYYNRGNARYDLEDYQGAIVDYTQVININPDDADAYYNRGNARYNLGNKQEAIVDFQKSTDLYRQAGKLAAHKNVREKILELEIEESLDILTF